MLTFYQFGLTIIITRALWLKRYECMPSASIWNLLCRERETFLANNIIILSYLSFYIGVINVSFILWESSLFHIVFGVMYWCWQFTLSTDYQQKAFTCDPVIHRFSHRNNSLYELYGSLIIQSTTSCFIININVMII